MLLGGDVWFGRGTDDRPIGTAWEEEGEDDDEGSLLPKSPGGGPNPVDNPGGAPMLAMERGSCGGDGACGTKEAAACVSDRKGDSASPVPLPLPPSPSAPPSPTLPLLGEILRSLKTLFPASTPLPLPLLPGAVGTLLWVRLLVESLHVQSTSTQPLHHPSPGRGGRIGAGGEEEDEEEDGGGAPFGTCSPRAIAAKDTGPIGECPPVLLPAPAPGDGEDCEGLGCCAREQVRHTGPAPFTALAAPCSRGVCFPHREHAKNLLLLPCPAPDDAAAPGVGI